MKEIIEKDNVIYNLVNDYKRLVRNRLQDLAKIAEERGIDEFGWEGEMPKEEDYDDEREYEEAWEEFNDSKCSLMSYSDYSTGTRELYMMSFSIDRWGCIYISSYYDDAEDELIDGYEIPIDMDNWHNVRAMAYIVSVVEHKLGIDVQ